MKNILKYLAKTIYKKGKTSTMLEIKDVVFNQLKNNIDTRNNDLLLIANCLEDLGLPTDIKVLARQRKRNITTSIVRMRRLLQADNPFLQSDENVIKARLKEESRYSEEVKKCV